MYFQFFNFDITKGTYFQQPNTKRYQSNDEKIIFKRGHQYIYATGSVNKSGKELLLNNKNKALRTKEFGILWCFITALGRRLFKRNVVFSKGQHRAALFENVISPFKNVTSRTSCGKLHSQ